VGQFKLVEVDGEVHQGVLGLLAGGEFLQLHLFYQFESTAQILGLRVAFQQDVV